VKHLDKFKNLASNHFRLSKCIKNLLHLKIDLDKSRKSRRKSKIKVETNLKRKLHKKLNNKSINLFSTKHPNKGVRYKKRNLWSKTTMK